MRQASPLQARSPSRPKLSDPNEASGFLVGPTAGFIGPYGTRPSRPELNDPNEASGFLVGPTAGFIAPYRSLWHPPLQARMAPPGARSSDSVWEWCTSDNKSDDYAWEWGHPHAPLPRIINTFVVKCAPLPHRIAAPGSSWRLVAAHPRARAWGSCTRAHGGRQSRMRARARGVLTRARRGVGWLLGNNGRFQPTIQNRNRNRTWEPLTPTVQRFSLSSV